MSELNKREDNGKCCFCFELGCGLKTLAIIYALYFIDNIYQAVLLFKANKGFFTGAYGAYLIISVIPVIYMVFHHICNNRKE